VEERDELQRDCERYNTMLELTTDPDARAAIEELIRQTRDRLSKIDEADDPSRTQNPRPAPPPEAAAPVLYASAGDLKS
jgi:hypothetical protein